MQSRAGRCPPKRSAGFIAVFLSLHLTAACVEVTGQRLCWDFIGDAIPCAGTGQDGDIQAGIRYPRPVRFTDNGDGTVTDGLTGLTWLKDARCFGDVSWADALKLANALASDRGPASCGLAGGAFASGAFRLPNVKELQSLVDFGYYAPALPNGAGTKQCSASDCAFEHVGVGRFYWSSTTRIDEENDNAAATKAMGVDLSNGVTIAHFKYHDLSEVRVRFAIWPVLAEPPRRLKLAAVEVTGQQTCWSTETPAPPSRFTSPEEIPCRTSGLPNPAAERQDGAIGAGALYRVPRFRSNGNGTVLDNLTGLVWMRDADCFGRNLWTESLDAVNTFASGLPCPRDGSIALTDASAPGDWRVPNVKELQSLIDFGAASTTGLALPPGHPFVNVEAPFYWSSTTAVGRSACAWSIAPGSGYTHYDSGSGGACMGQAKAANPRRVWPVRDRRSLEDP